MPTETVSQPPLIPYPRSWEKTDQAFTLKGPFSIQCPEQAEPAAAVLAGALQPFGKSTIGESSSSGKGAIKFQVETDGPSSEAYELEISSETITLSGSLNGIHRGIATLRQFLMHATREHMGGAPASLAGGVIRDEPKYPWRGVLLDSSRHFFSVTKVLQYIDLLSLFKMNRFHWHLTDDQGWRLEIVKYPKLTEIGAWRGRPQERYGGYYTQKEVREVVQYAAARGIEVIPEIDIPGHSTAIVAAYPEYGCSDHQVEVETDWGIKMENLNPGKDATFTFLEGVFEEVAELFPSPWIHLGADECQKEPWRADDACQQRIAAEGLKDERELQTWFINRVLKILEKHNRIGIGWDEVLEGGLPDNIVVQSWQDHQFTVDAARLGAQVIATPIAWCYINYGTNCIDLARAHSFNPLPDDLEPEFHDRILGGECTLWTEFITETDIDYLAFPRTLAIAEALWKPEGRPATFDHFQERVARFYPILSDLDVAYGPATALNDPHHQVFGRTSDFRPPAG